MRIRHNTISDGEVGMMKIMRFLCVITFIYTAMMILPGATGADSSKSLGGGGQYTFDLGGGGQYIYMNLDSGIYDVANISGPEIPVVGPGPHGGSHKVELIAGIDNFISLGDGYLIDLVLPEGGGGQYNVVYAPLGGGGQYSAHIVPMGGGGQYILHIKPKGGGGQYSIRIVALGGGGQY